MKIKMNLKGSMRSIFNGLISDGSNKINPVIFALIAILGICAGVGIEATNSDVLSSISVAYVDYFDVNTVRGFGISFINYVICNVIYILAPMFLGLCILGFPFLYSVTFIKGLGLGAVSGYIYSVYGIRGVSECLICIIPSGVFLLVGIMLACNESFLMSRDILFMLKNKNENEEISIKFYILRYLIIFIILIVSSLLFSGGILISRLFFVKFSA